VKREIMPTLTFGIMKGRRHIVSRIRILAYQVQRGEGAIKQQQGERWEVVVRCVAAVAIIQSDKCTRPDAIVSLFGVVKLLVEIVRLMSGSLCVSSWHFPYCL